MNPHLCYSHKADNLCQCLCHEQSLTAGPPMTTSLHKVQEPLEDRRASVRADNHIVSFPKQLSNIRLNIMCWDSHLLVQFHNKLVSYFGIKFHLQ